MLPEKIKEKNPTGRYQEAFEAVPVMHVPGGIIKYIHAARAQLIVSAHVEEIIRCQQLIEMQLLLDEALPLSLGLADPLCFA